MADIIFFSLLGIAVLLGLKMFIEEMIEANNNNNHDHHLDDIESRED